MKKILTSLFAAGLLLTTAIPAMAQDSQPTTTSLPVANWKVARATPGHPVSLTGQGEVGAAGRGKYHYRVNSGRVSVNGHGVVAVKGAAEVRANGFGGKQVIGEWTYYYGEGKLKASGSGYELVFWGNGNTKATGSGRVTYRGFWTVRYRGVNLSEVHEETIPLPSDLQSQAGADASLE